MSENTTGTATSRARLARKAVRKQTRARLALSGPSGSGKTWTALSIARIIAPGKPIVVIDTEPGDGAQGAATLYADHFDFDSIEWEPPFDPRDLTLTIRDLGREYDDGVGIIDSASHFWRGPGGTLDIADGRFGGWKSATPAQDAMVEAILRSPMHWIICTRAKQSYEVEQGQDGKQNVRKLGLAPIQRDDLEYEFQVVAMMDDSHRIDVGKTRAAPLAGMSFAANEQDRFADIYAEWLAGGASLARQIEVDALLPAIKAVPETRRAALRADLVETFGPASSLTDEAMPAVWARIAGDLGVDPHRFDDDGEGFCTGCRVPAVARWHQDDAPPMKATTATPPPPPAEPEFDVDGDGQGTLVDEGTDEPIADLDDGLGDDEDGIDHQVTDDAPQDGQEEPAGTDGGEEPPSDGDGDADGSPQPPEDNDAAAARLDEVIEQVKGMTPRQINDALAQRGAALGGNVSTLSARLVTLILADEGIDVTQVQVKERAS